MYCAGILEKKEEEMAFGRDCTWYHYVIMPASEPILLLHKKKKKKRWT